MNASSERAPLPGPTGARAGLLPALGAGLVTLATIGLSIGFLNWRAGAERRVLDANSAKCRAGDRAACDQLRGACLKRSPDACVSLSDAYFAEGPNHDATEALRLLGDACVFHHAGACLRGGRMHLEGTVTPKDVAQAKTLLDRGCDFGAHEACALRQTLP